MTRGEIRPLTGIRAVAALWVVAYHLGGWLYAVFPPARNLSAVVDRGYLGVDLFFLLTGFVLAYNYGEAFASYNPAGHGRFLLHRLARIYPVHLFTILLIGAAYLACAATGRAFHYAPLGAENLAANLLLVHAWGFSERSWNAVSWAISVQWLGYLVFPFIWKCVTLVRSPRAAGAMAFGLLLLLVPAFPGSLLGEATYRGAVTRLLVEMTAGCLLYRTYVSGEGRRTGHAAVAVVATIGIGCVCVFADNIAWTAPLTGLVALSVAYDRGIVARVLSWRPVVFLGTISYSLYMTHHLVLYGITRLLSAERLAGCGAPARLVGLVAVLAVILAFAWGTYALVESPLRRRLRAWIHVR